MEFNWKWVFSSQKIFWILLATTAVWLLLKSAYGNEILHTSLVLTLIWENIIGKFLFHLYRPAACDNTSLYQNKLIWFTGFWMWPINFLFLQCTTACFFPFWQQWLTTEYKNTKRGRAALTMCHLTLSDLHWEVTGPLCCLQPCNSPDFILHRERPQQPGQHPLSSSEMQSGH